MNPCFENAIDSLVVGIGFYTGKNTKYPNKHAILAVYHAVELLLKARLYKENFLFVFRKPEKPIKDDSQTVGLEEALGLLSNLGVSLEPKKLKDLRSLKRRRNRIEHFEYREQDEDSDLLGKALGFLIFFLNDHLDESLEDHLDVEQCKIVHELVLSYEERLKLAKAAVEKLLPADLSEGQGDNQPIWCPECSTHSIVVEVGGTSHCYFCKEDRDMSQCEYCQEYVPEYEFDEDLGMCDLCQDHFSSR